MNRKLMPRMPPVVDYGLVGTMGVLFLTCTTTSGRTDRWEENHPPCSPRTLPDMLKLPHCAMLECRGTVNYRRHNANMFRFK